MASFTVPCSKTSSLAFLGSNPRNSQRRQQKQQLSFSSMLSSSPSLSFGSAFGFQCLDKKQSSVRMSQAQLKEDNPVVESSNSAPIPVDSSGSKRQEDKDDPTGPVTDESQISAFLEQVSDLVKLVDSRDIVELRLKQSGCELTIRKKEALQQPTAAPVQFPQQMFASPPPIFSTPAPVPAPASQPPSSPAPASAPAPRLPPPKSSSSHPPLKSPMAGTFYRSPAPGAPPFVKIGDKVQKGQVVCIVEAMKLMNEIEADKDGTIAEILLEDGKQVSFDTPLLVIVP